MAYNEAGGWELTDAELATQAAIVRAAYAANPSDPQGFMAQIRASGQVFMAPAEYTEPLRALGAPEEYVNAAFNLRTDTPSGNLFSAPLKETAPLSLAALGANYFAPVAGAAEAASAGSSLAAAQAAGAAGVTGAESALFAPAAAAAAGGAAGAEGASTGGASVAGTAVGAAAGGGALASLQRVLDNGGTVDDWLKLLGTVGPAALGAYASNEQAGKLAELSEKYMGFGAPSRARFESSFAPGFTMETEPGYKDALDATTKSFLHKASVAGNPADSPNAWEQTLKDVNASFAYPALNEYRRLNAGTGGLATLTAAAPSAATSAIGAERGIYDAIGAGAADIFNPRKSLSDLWREFQRAGY